MSLNKTVVCLFASMFLSGPLFADDLLDANTASAEQLATLTELDDSGITTILSERPFATIGDLNTALGGSMSEDERAALYGRLFVRIDLNTASREDILLIPGVGPRMAHEFEEYRPYSSMEQFRREIGKYVDEDEVARLEMYVGIE